MEDDEIAYLLKLRETYEQSLRMNRIKKAGFGNFVGPGYIDIEIAEAEKGIRLVDAQLGMVQAPQDIVDAIGPKDAGTMLVDYRVKLLDKKLSDAFLHISEKVGEVAESVLQIRNQVIEHKVIADTRYDQEQRVRTERQKEHDERMTVIDTALETNTEQVSLLAKRISSRRWLEIAVVVLSLLAVTIYWQFLR